ncbi:hypothetical protein ACFWGI_37970 [Streptomyces niveus]|uniref:hypothetical protein n=1 Tax=Streptomyces niveus TaxID=193462 RepID=UPI00366629A9
MPTFDPTTTSGVAVADLFRTWCALRGDMPGAQVDGIELAKAVGEMFQALGLDPVGPASQVDRTAAQHVCTVFGSRCDHTHDLHVAAVAPGEHADAVINLSPKDDPFGRRTSIFTTASAGAADTARRQVENGDTEAFSDRMTASPEVTCGYPANLLETLRESLIDWFQDHPEHARPSRVEFDVTSTYPEGAAWSEWGPTFHYPSAPEREERKDIPVERVMTGVDFTGTSVADALVELDEWQRPTYGDTLRVATPPTTDYRAAADVVSHALELAGTTTLRSALAALALVDENADFGQARDDDPVWPTKEEADSVSALRALRDTRNRPGVADTEESTARTTTLTALRCFRDSLERLASPNQA